MTGPDVHVRDTETGAEYFISEFRFKNQPKRGLWVRLDQGKPKTSVAVAAANKKAKSGHQADSNQEES